MTKGTITVIVVLLPSSLLLYALGISLGKPVLNAAGRACLYLATISALGAVISGLIAQDSFPHNETIHHLMETHESMAIMVLIMAIALSAWSFAQADHRPRGAPAFLTLLALANLAVMQTADLGGRMVFVEGAAVRPAAAVIAGEHAQEDTHKAATPAAAPPEGHKHHDHRH